MRIGQKCRILEGRDFIPDTTEPSRNWIQKYIYPDDQPQVQAAIEKAIAAKKVFELEHRVVRVDGTLGWTHSRATPLLNGQGEIVEWVGAAADVTTRKAGEESLRQSEGRYRVLAETLETQVRERTRALEQRNLEMLSQSEQLRALSAEILSAQDEKRRRLARELHDNAGQTLTALSIEHARIAKRLTAIPDLAEQMKYVQNLAENLTQEIRTTSYLLHPPMLDDGGVANALRWYVNGLSARTDLTIDLQVPQDFGRLPATEELTVFRIVQEALTNIHGHSGSKDAVIRIGREETSVSVEIEDHGKGMSTDKVREIQAHGGVGVRGMRERLHQLNGELSIESGPSGTTIKARIPVPARSSPAAGKAAHPGTMK